MKIVLINPPAYRQVEEYDIPRWQHLGIGRISSYLKRFGHDVVLIDAKLQKLNISEVLVSILQKRPDVVGLTAMTPDVYNAYSVAKGIKEIDKEIVTLMGGCHATVMPEKTLKEEPSLDYLVVGEGERAFKELLDVIGSEDPLNRLKQIKGLALRDNGGVVRTEARCWDVNIEELPAPDWQLHEYASHYQLETSRGCPYSCNFCMRVLGNTVRYFPVKNILRELETAMQYKSEFSMEIVDETFTLNHERVQSCLDGMIEIGVPKKIRWYCSTRANLVSRSLLKKMKKAGCYCVIYGVESGNQNVLNRIGKNIKLQDVMNAVRITREVGMKSFLNFILGHPYETLEEMIDTINFAAKVNPNVAALGTMVPYPGTEIYDMVKNGSGNYRLLSDDWTQYNRQFSYVLELNDVSKRDMDKLQLVGTFKLFIFNWRIIDLIKFVFKYRREALKFFRMLFMQSTEKGENISHSRMSFFQLIQILFSSYREIG